MSKKFFQFFVYFLNLTLITAIVCPRGWTYYMDRCWYKSENQKSWFDADSECRERYGSFLATIQDEKESSFLGMLKAGDEMGLKFFDQSDPHFMDCFVKMEKAALLGSSVMSPSNVKTAEQCVEECAKSQARYDQVCKSVLWYRESRECVLNDKTRNETDAVFVQDPELTANIDYYEKTCELTEDDEDETPLLPSGSAPTPKTNRPSSKKKNPKEILGIRSCFSKFKHSSLVGFVDRIHDNVTERECLTKCWKCEKCLTQDNEPCKSVIYYESVKQCILTKESRRTQVDYFDQSEPLAMFFERRKDCLFEMCEDQEVDLIFAVDGSAKMNWFGFDKALRLIDSIVTTIHETTEFWRATVVQVGTEGPSVVEIPRKSFDTLDDFRRALATVGWRRSPGNRLGDSLVDVADMAMRYADGGETDFVWLITLSPGYSNDSLDDFEMLKKQNYFTSFAVGVGADLEYVNLQKIATSSAYLIHSQDEKQVVKDISSKLCPKDSGIFEAETTVTSTSESAPEKPQMTLPDEFVSKTDAYKSDPWILHDDVARKNLKSSGIRTMISPSTIAFMGGASRHKNAEKFKKFLSSGDKLKKLAAEFVSSLRNDTVVKDDEDDNLRDRYWIGFKRSELGALEWSDGSKVGEFDAEKSRHLEVGMDVGDCVYWGSNVLWKQQDCYEKLAFVCNMKPAQTINQKLDTDFGINAFEASSFNKDDFEANLESFMPIPMASEDTQTEAPAPQPPTTTTPRQSATYTHVSSAPQTISPTPHLFNWGPDKYTTKMRASPPSATPPNSSENEEIDPQKLLETSQMSQFLVPFAG